jgi:hypothetical protein
MAYIPDEAIERMGEISGNAFKLFNFYCSKADKHTGESFYKAETIAKEMKWRKNHVYEHRKALLAENWITLDGDTVKVAFGFPRPSNESENGTKTSPKIGLKEVPEVQKPDLVSPKTGLVESENGTKTSPKIGLAYKEEPDQLTRPENQRRSAPAPRLRRFQMCRIPGR